MGRALRATVIASVAAAGLLAGVSSQAQSTCGNASPDPGEECDDGNQMSGDGCSATCQIENEGDYDCTPAIPATPPVNLVGNGSFEVPELGPDWTIVDHSLFGTLFCGDGCLSPLASDLDGNIVSGIFILLAGGSFSTASTGTVEHRPIVFTEEGTTLQFNYGIGTVGGTGAACAGPDDGIRLLIDGMQVWSNLDSAPNNECVGVDVYTVVDIDL